MSGDVLSQAEVESLLSAMANSGEAAAASAPTPITAEVAEGLAQIAGHGFVQVAQPVQRLRTHAFRRSAVAGGLLTHRSILRFVDCDFSGDIRAKPQAV